MHRIYRKIVGRLDGFLARIDRSLLSVQEGESMIGVIFVDFRSSPSKSTVGYINRPEGSTVPLFNGLIDRARLGHASQTIFLSPNEALIISVTSRSEIDAARILHWTVKFIRKIMEEK